MDSRTFTYLLSELENSEDHPYKNQLVLILSGERPEDVLAELYAIADEIEASRAPRQGIELGSDSTREVIRPLWRGKKG